MGKKGRNAGEGNPLVRAGTGKEAWAWAGAWAWAWRRQVRLGKRIGKERVAEEAGKVGRVTKLLAPQPFSESLTFLLYLILIMSLYNHAIACLMQTGPLPGDSAFDISL